MRILVTGAGGLLGRPLSQRLSESHDVLAVYRRVPPELEPHRLRVSVLDLTQKAAVERILTEHTPELVINCAAATDVDRCELEPRYAEAANVTIVRNLLEALSSTDCRFIHFSTDYVFPGTKGPWSEADLPQPLNYYGKTKLEAEHLIRRSDVVFSIIRVCALYSSDLSGGHSYPSKVFRALSNGERFPAALDLYSNPTEVSDIVSAVTKFVERFPPPILHLAAADYLSRYEFAQLLAKKLNLDDSLVEPTSSEQLSLPATRPKRAGLRSLFSRSLNIGNLRTPYEVFERTK